MIRKISGSEYLKRYDNMSASERTEYESRVGGWLSVDGQALVKRCETFEARLQNVLQVSAGWNDQECQAFEDGAVLLSALVGQADTWLPDMLYVKSAKRAVKLMFEALWRIDAGSLTPSPSPTGEGSVGGGKVAEKDTKGSGTSVSLVPARPKHIDDYVHLLPEKTQEHASHYGELMDELRESRRKLDLLMEDKTATDKDREAWAKKVKKLDDTIGAIKRELDEGWNNLVKQGRVVVDDLGMAHVLPLVQTSDGKEAVQTTPTEDCSIKTQSPNLGGEGAAEMTSEDKDRRRSIRKWLVDTRRGNGDTREEHVKKWQENFREFLAFEGDAAYEDEKVMAAAEHYGIDIKGVRSQETGDSSQES